MVTLMLLLTGPRGREGGEIIRRELGGIIGMPPTVVRRTSGVQCYIGPSILRTRTRTLATTARGCAR